MLFAKFRAIKNLLRDIGGQRWLIDATPTNAYLTAHKECYKTEMVFGFGMILTLVVTFFLLIISKREEIQK